jgi:pimeloyl-ACP methyl ester carboxylesterase
VVTSFAQSPDGTPVAYDHCGTGPAIMLIHGGGKRRDWHEAGYVRRPQDSFTVIATDLRGHGQSGQPKDPADYTVEKMTQDLLAVADVNEIRRFIIWSMSYGGKVSRYLAAQSERVAKIILPVMLAWVRAMLDWSAVEPADFRCPALWLIGSDNPYAMASLKAREELLKGSAVRVSIVEGLDHEQVFTEVDSIFPAMLAFSAP